MEFMQTFGPLLGVVVGGLLTGAGAHYKVRAEKKRVVAAALSDLLEARHRIVAVEAVIEEIRRRAEIGPEQMAFIRNLIDAQLPTGEFEERYDRAVTLLCTVDPVLGHSVRSKQALPSLLGSLRGQAATGGVDLVRFESFERSLLAAALPSINASLRSLAWAHSFTTWLKVRRLIGRPGAMPEAVRQFVDKIAEQEALQLDPQPETGT